MNKELINHTSLKNLPKEDRPQERLERLGPSPLTDRELLAMIVRSGSSNTMYLPLQMT